MKALLVTLPAGAEVPAGLDGGLHDQNGAFNRMKGAGRQKAGCQMRRGTTKRQFRRSEGTVKRKITGRRYECL